MKNTKKFAAFVASILAVACMAAPMATSFSADAEGSIEIVNAKENHTYEAYQIFDGDLSNGVLSNIVWGSGIDDTKTSDLITAIQAIDGFSSCTDAASVAEKLAEITDFDSDTTKQFASVVGQYLSATKTDSTFADGKYTISGVDDGYYLVKDKDESLDQAHDAKTRYIVHVLGTKTEIAPKSSFPTVEKKVLEDDKDVTGKPTYDAETTEKWNDVADYCIGEAVPFKLYGTMPDTIGDYTKYKYVFHDTLASQFTAPNASAVTVKIDGTEAKNAVVDVTGQNITVTFADIKNGNTVTADSIVTVEYSAVLNSNAVIGLDGQQNEVYLTYSNNPNWVGTGENDTPNDEGKTPKDAVIVFTYELDTTKVDGADNTKKLADAEFKLLNEAKDKEAEVTDGKFVKWVDIDAGTTLKSGSDGLFKVAGLDDGTYYLKETKAPAGYNLLANPVEVVVTATTVNNQEWGMTDASAALTNLEVTAAGKAGTADTSTGVASITIANNAGSTLPSTGGIGTTIFYVAGGALVVGAGVLLVSKKRMSNK